MVKKVYEWKPMSIRPQGRPKNRWEYDIRNDTKKLKIKNWISCIQDRNNWNHVLRGLKRTPKKKKKKKKEEEEEEEEEKKKKKKKKEKKEKKEKKKKKKKKMVSFGSQTCIAPIRHFAHCT